MEPTTTLYANHLNAILTSSSKLQSLEWEPFYHGYDKKTQKHNGVLKEMASPCFSDREEFNEYVKVLMLHDWLVLTRELADVKMYRFWVQIGFEADAKERLLLYDRAIGCLVGLAVGDALGVTQECFPVASGTNIIDATVSMVKQKRQELAKKPQTGYVGQGPWVKSGTILRPGDFTDDTSMALCLADSLIENGDLLPKDVMERFVRWWDKGYNASMHGNPVGLGGNISVALRKFKTNPTTAGALSAGGTNDATDAGNGSIMRLAPVAIYWHKNIGKAMEMAKLQCMVTHNVAEARDACALMAFMMCRALQGASKQTIFDELPLLLGAAGGKLAAAIEHKEIAELASANAKWKTAKTQDDIITLPGRTLWSLEAALWCIWHTSSFEQAVLKATNLSGDADTVGAIVGQLAGAIYGRACIPEPLVSGLQHHDKIAKRAQLLARGTKCIVPKELSIP